MNVLNKLGIGVVAILIIAGGWWYLNREEIQAPSEDVWSNKELNVSYNSFQIKSFINKPAGNELDLLLLFHGTNETEAQQLEGAKRFSVIAKQFQEKNPKLMTASILYNSGDILQGGVIPIDMTEAALLWFKNESQKNLGVKINKIYLLGHSQGGFIVLKLNQLQKVDGVIANAPGPIDLKFRCEIEERNPNSATADSVCSSLAQTYGKTTVDPVPYEQRSIISDVSGMKAPMLLIQGLEDTRFQTTLMSKLVQAIQSCGDCADATYVPVAGADHSDPLKDPKILEQISAFIAK